MRLASTFPILLSLATLGQAQTGRPVLPGKAKMPPRGFPQGMPTTKPVVEPVTLAVVKDTSTEQNSENGWYLSPHGTIRILVLFAEVVYDKNPGKDPQAEGAEHWPKGQLPRWKDNIFDPQQLKVPKATVTRYYHDISLGQYIVLGDHIDHLFTLRESEYPTAANGGSANALVIKEANTLPAFRTAHGLTPADFDLWKDGAAVGMPKTPGADDPHSYDHVMVILRNSSLTHGQGSTDPGSSGKLFGYESDTQSRFGGMNALPFEILKHEFNHLLLGSNNFHSGGGNAAQFDSYSLCVQGGWSMMGASSSSLLTCSGWDRDRLGWRLPNAPFRINARDAEENVINGDLDPIAGDTGIFLLRDLVTSGDALRIRMPFLPEGEHQQWLWVENHQTYALNGSPTDRFHWEDTNNPCIAKARPGLFMTMQIERDNKRGRNIFGGYADYLRPLTACGHYDLELTDDTLRGTCPFGGQTIAFRRVRENPLSGNSEQELVVYDRNGDDALERGEHFVPCILKAPGGDPSRSPRFFGRPDHAFSAGGSRVLSMASNPSSANMLTLTAGGKREKNKGGVPDNRTVYLNGLRVELLEQRSDGPILLRVSTGATRINNDVTWCADSIVLPPLRGKDGRSLIMSAGKRMVIDRSLTPTRMALQGEVQGRPYFSPPTRFTISSGASVLFEPGSELRLETGSTLHLMPGSELLLDISTKLNVDPSSRIVVHGDAKLAANAKAMAKLEKNGRLVRSAD